MAKHLWALGLMLGAGLLLDFRVENGLAGLLRAAGTAVVFFPLAAGGAYLPLTPLRAPAGTGRGRRTEVGSPGQRGVRCAIRAVTGLGSGGGN